MADLVTNDEVNAYMGTTGVDYSADIARASRRVESKIGPVVYTSYTERHDGGRDCLLLGYSPVKIDSVTITDMESGQTVPATDYIVDESGVIYCANGVWGWGRNRYEVTYQAGLCPDVASVPADIKEATLLLIKASKSGGASAVVKSKRVGQTAIEYDTSNGGSVQTEVDSLLAPYMGVGL